MYLKDLLKPYDLILEGKNISKKGSERSDLIKQFMEEINKERAGTKFSKVNYMAVNMKLAHVPLKDLYYFMSDCKDYKNRHGSFSKFFFGNLKIK